MSDCQGCDARYDVDLLIQDDLWNQITPGEGYQGMLCPNCICTRLIKLGMSAVICHVDTKELEAHDGTRDE